MAGQTPAAEQCCILLAAIPIRAVLDVAHSGYLTVHVAGLGPSLVMTWLEQQLQISSLPKSGELQFNGSLLISRRCRDSNKLVRQREEEGAECPVWDVCEHVSVHAYVCTHTHRDTQRLTLTDTPLPIVRFTSAPLGPHSHPFLPVRAGKGCEASLCCVSPTPLSAAPSTQKFGNHRLSLRRC